MKRIGFIDARRVAGFTFPATATPGRGEVVDVTDPSVGAVGTMTYAKTLRYRPTGDKTVNQYGGGYNIEVYPEGDIAYLSGMSVYFAGPTGNPVVDSYWGGDIFMEPLGALATVNSLAGINIGMNYTNPCDGDASFLRLYVHGTTLMPSLIYVGGQGAVNLIHFHAVVQPVIAAAVGGAQNYKIRVNLGAVGVRYIPLHET